MDKSDVTLLYIARQGHNLVCKVSAVLMVMFALVSVALTFSLGILSRAWWACACLILLGGLFLLLVNRNHMCITLISKFGIHINGKTKDDIEPDMISLKVIWRVIIYEHLSVHICNCFGVEVKGSSEAFPTLHSSTVFTASLLQLELIQKITNSTLKFKA